MRLRSCPALTPCGCGCVCPPEADKADEWLFVLRRWCSFLYEPRIRKHEASWVLSSQLQIGTCNRPCLPCAVLRAVLTFLCVRRVKLAPLPAGRRMRPLHENSQTMIDLIDEVRAEVLTCCNTYHCGVLIVLGGREKEC